MLGFFEKKIGGDCKGIFDRQSGDFQPEVPGNTGPTPFVQCPFLQKNLTGTDILRYVSYFVAKNASKFYRFRTKPMEGLLYNNCTITKLKIQHPRKRFGMAPISQTRVDPILMVKEKFSQIWNPQNIAKILRPPPGS